MSLRRPLVIVTRKLPDAIETRMMELFDARLNLEDRPMGAAELGEAAARAQVLVPTVTDRIDKAVLAKAGPELKLIASFGIRSMLASVPKMMTPALSFFFFWSAILLTSALAASCCADGTLSERSSTKNTFIPSTGNNHCSPAIANTSARQTMVRNPSAVHRRHGEICTSVFHASQKIHASAGSASNR